MSLKKFIAQENEMTRLFPRSGGKLYDISNLSEDDKKALAGNLACALSPENLCCDGELRGAKLRAKANMLYKARQELEATGVKLPY